MFLNNTPHQRRPRANSVRRNLRALPGQGLRAVAADDRDRAHILMRKTAQVVGQAEHRRLFALPRTRATE